MPGTFELRIVTPTRTLFEGQVEMVRAPGAEGSFQVFPRHLPLVSTLEVGEIDFRVTDGGDRTAATSGGFVEILRSGVTVLAESAEFGEEIDLERAEEAARRARERLAAKDADIDSDRAKGALRRALNRLRTAGGSGGG